MEAIQFIQYTPEQLQEEILKGIKTYFEPILNKLQVKEEDELLKPKEVAQMLKVNLSTVHNLYKAGKLNKYGIGNNVYYRRSEIKLIQINQ